MHDLIIDTDPGNGIPGSDIDDALAIGLALLSPDVRLLGLTTVAGNTPLEKGTACALQLLEVAGRGDVAVYPGADRPLVADPTAVRAWVDGQADTELGRQLWQGVPVPRPTRAANRRRATDFIIDTIMARPGEVILVPIGPLTNVAMALRLEPRLASAVQRIVLMGGSLHAPGGPTSPVTEFNASYDPEATHIVFRSGAPITMVGLDVTTRTMLTLEDVALIRAAGTPLARYLADITEPWVHLQRERRGLAGCRLHDPLAVCAVIDPAVVRTEAMAVTVELGSAAVRGQTVGWSRRAGYVAPAPGGAVDVDVDVDVCVEVDNQRFMALFRRTLGVADGS